jgi:hypothetical protein
MVIRGGKNRGKRHSYMGQLGLEGEWANKPINTYS